MEIKKGIGVSPGVWISTAIVLDAEVLLIPRRTVADDQVAHEIERFETAIRESAAELDVLRTDITRLHGKEIGGIFDFHLGILKDKTMVNQIIAEIKNQKTTAEYGVSVV